LPFTGAGTAVPRAAGGLVLLGGGAAMLLTRRSRVRRQP